MLIPRILLTLSLSLSLSLSICPNCSSLMGGSLDGIQNFHRVDECKSLLVGQCWCLDPLDHTSETRFWVLSLLLLQCPTNLVHLTSIVSEMGVKWPFICFLSCAASRSSSKQHATVSQRLKAMLTYSKESYRLLTSGYRLYRNVI